MQAPNYKAMLGNKVEKNSKTEGNGEEVLVVNRVAEILHIKPNTIHNKKWQKRTGCPLIKKGKRLYALPSEFWKWFKQGN